MPSPFPGMNPYLEQDDAWHDFHERFLPRMADALAAQVRPHFFVKVDEHMFIHELSAEQRRFLGRADVFVAQHDRRPSAAAAATIAAPAHGLVPVAVDTERQCYLSIRDRANRQLVTVVELLSPSNKAAGADREQYLAKRRQILQGNVHLVEIDLLRGGPRLPIEEFDPCDYYAMVSRSERRPRVELWPIGLRDPLPTIPVPLTTAYPDATLDLQTLLHQTYDAAGYEDYIYAGRPDPPLAPDAAAWAGQFLPTSGPIV